MEQHGNGHVGPNQKFCSGIVCEWPIVNRKELESPERFKLQGRSEIFRETQVDKPSACVSLGCPRSFITYGKACRMCQWRTDESVSFTSMIFSSTIVSSRSLSELFSFSSCRRAFVETKAIGCSLANQPRVTLIPSGMRKNTLERQHGTIVQREDLMTIRSLRSQIAGKIPGSLLSDVLQ